MLDRDDLHFVGFGSPQTARLNLSFPNHSADFSDYPKQSALFAAALDQY